MQAEILKFRQDIRTLLGPESYVPLRVCLGLRRFLVSRRLAFLARVLIPVVLSSLVGEMVQANTMARPQDSTSDERLWSGPVWHQGALAGPLVLAIVVFVAGCALALVGTLAALITVPMSAWRGTTSSAFRCTRWATRYRLVYGVAETIHACARALDAADDDRPLRLRQVAQSLAGTSRLIRRAYRDWGSIGWPSHRRTGLRRHAGQVLAAVHAAEARLDTDGDAALRELASLLMTVCHRHVCGRVGALLDEEVLAGLEPVADWEWVRLVVALAVASGAAVGAALLPLPAMAEPYALSGAATTAFMLVYTNQSGRALQLWGNVRI